ncbi:FecR domain-containing protein [Collimonas sp. NPDC087041]|uniref:FecR family protein n=1 Tax=Collimonas sp. NPDC087041 TaxID=3363960 RepID=UPI0037F40686
MTKIKPPPRRPLNSANERRLNCRLSNISRKGVLTLLMIATPAFAQAQGEQTHVVRPGETLWDISHRYLQSPLHWPEIQRDNAVPTPEKLRPGKILLLNGELAVVAELSGSAWLKRGEDSQKPVAIGARINAGDILVTAQDSFMSLRLPDGSRVVMPSSSAIKVLAINGQLVRFQLLNGRLESHVEKQNGRHFEIRTRTAELGVRGTHFRTRDEDGIEAVEVIEGEVEVKEVGASSQNLVLDARHGTVLIGENSMQSQPLLPAPQLIETNVGRQVLISPLEGATSYRLQLAHDDRFIQLVYEDRSSAPNFNLPTTLERGFYHLRLTAFDARKLEGLNGDSLIHLPNAQSQQSSVQPNGNGLYDIRWPSRAGQRFMFEMARTERFSPLLAHQLVSDASGVTVGPLLVPGRYYWRSREVPDNSDEPASNTAASFSGSFTASTP